MLRICGRLHGNNQSRRLIIYRESADDPDCEGHQGKGLAEEFSEPRRNELMVNRFGKDSRALSAL